ncbi:Tetratricopeptide repeat-containing protein [Rubrobacter radiotolerans DSM 5868]|nr:Tetratricopeptide repeat-containing protein [Rubrobacter radiotolerans DSM 5868]
MMNRDRLGFWARLIAIFLALVFISSFVFLGIGGNVSYNLFDLIGGSDDQQNQQSQANLDEQIQNAEREYRENPGDPQAVQTLAGLYFSNSQFEEAERVLREGREANPENAELASLLGSVYAQRAAQSGEENRERLYRDSAEQYAAAAEIEPENSDYPLLAGQSFEQAGDAGRAIQFYNSYLDLEPDGENAQAVRERIDTLLTPAETTGAAEEG